MAAFFTVGVPSLTGLFESAGPLPAITVAGFLMTPRARLDST
jgi:hypothetical protein